MLKTEDFRLLSKDSLRSRITLLAAISTSLAVMLVFLTGLLIYQMFKSGSFNVLIVVPLALFPILLFNFSTLRKMKAEMKKRK